MLIFADFVLLLARLALTLPLNNGIDEKFIGDNAGGVRLSDGLSS